MRQMLFRVEQELSAPSVTVQLRSSVWEQAADLEVTMATYTLTTMVSGMSAWMKPAGDPGVPRSFYDLGHIYYLPKGAPLVIRPKAIGMNQHLACVFSPEIVDHIGLSTVANENPLCGRNLEGRAVKPLLDLILRELYQPGFASPLLIDSLGLSVGIELSRTLMERASHRKPEGGLAAWQLRRIRERIVEQDDMPTIADLATLCGISQRHLIRAFKQSTDVTIGQFAEAIRIDRAKHYLVSGMSIKQVAAKLGFQSASNFSAAFKRAVAVPPSAFRMNVRQGSQRTYALEGDGGPC